MINQSELKEALDYNPSSGVFTAKTSGGGRIAGSVAGGKSTDGYTSISVNGIRYRAARLAWLWMTGEHPSGDVDHIDGNRRNDAWNNLRAATRRQNMANTKAKSGLKGACWVPSKAKWKAQIRIGGKNKHIGYFETAELANDAYREAAIEAHGEFARW